MKTYTQTNWIGGQSLEVSHCQKSKDHDATVQLYMRIGPFGFSEHLTLQQAIDFAAAIVECATETQEEQAQA